MSRFRGLSRQLARSTLWALALVVGLVSAGLAAPADSPFSISIEPVLVRMDGAGRDARARAFGLDVNVKLWSVHAHLAWPGIPLPSAAPTGRGPRFIGAHVIALPAGSALRGPALAAHARLHRGRRRWRSRSASARTPRSSRSSTPCCSIACRSRTPGSARGRVGGQRAPSRPTERRRPGELLQWKRSRDSFERMAGLDDTRVNLTGRGRARRARSRKASRRTSSPCSACRRSSAATSRPTKGHDRTRPLVVLGYALWQRRFGGDACHRRPDDRVERPAAFTVIGVMPEGVGAVPESGSLDRQARGSLDAVCASRRRSGSRAGGTCRPSPG